MKSYPSDRIRNVGLFSHGGSGKTSLAEAMLFASGTISRLGRVEEGTTTSDYDPDEQRRHISVQLSLLPYEWNNCKVNLIDTPGYFDFVGEVKQTVRVVEGAILVFTALTGVEVGTEQAWNYCQEAGCSRLAFINKMDRENADFGRTLEQLQARLGPSLVPIQLPIGAEARLQGVVDLIDMQAYIGPQGEAGEIPADVKAEADALREKLVESICEQDDDLIAKYLEGEEVTPEELRRGLRAGVVAGTLIPVLAGSATATIGIQPLLNAIVDFLPAADDRSVKAHNEKTGQDETLKPEDAAPLAALVFKTAADPFRGNLTYLRVYAGTLKSDSTVYNANRTHDERIGQLFMLHGKGQDAVPQIGAGDIGAVAKLQSTGTSDTLGTKDHPLTLAPVVFPRPLYSAAVEPKSRADLDKLGDALHRLIVEDPTLHMQKDADTSEMILSGMGESHLDIAAERLKRKFGVDVLLHTPRVSYKETIQLPTRAEYKHKKQSGGRGQYGHVLIRMEPQERGAGFEFAEEVVGGNVPRNFIPAVEKGIREALPEGVLAGCPVVDVKVVLYDGSSHPVDSSEMAFKLAASQAFKKAMEQARPVLLEPVMRVRVTVPEEYMGDVMSDLTGKRARVGGMDSQSGVSIVEASGPLAELQHYAADLRSITQGRGIYEMEFSHYDEVPAHILPNVVEQVKKQQEEKKD